MPSNPEEIDEVVVEEEPASPEVYLGSKAVEVAKGGLFWAARGALKIVKALQGVNQSARKTADYDILVMHMYLRIEIYRKKLK